VPQRRQGQGRPLPRLARRDAQGGRIGPGRRAGRTRKEPPDPCDPPRRRRSRHAAQAGGLALGGADPRLRELGQDGRSRSPGGRRRAASAQAGDQLRRGAEVLELPSPLRPGGARGPGEELAPERDRSVHPRQARGKEPSPCGGRGSPDAAAARDVRPDRPSAHARGDGGLPRRLVARRALEGRGPAAGLAPLRRAVGPPLAGRRPLRRYGGMQLRLSRFPRSTSTATT
jgi:hypothetical protein